MEKDKPVITGLSILCLALIVTTLYIHHRDSTFKVATESNILATASVAMINAEKELSVNDSVRASQYIEQASGALMAGFLTMRKLGYDHVSDIAMHLSLIAAHAQKGSLTASEKQYLKESEVNLHSLFNSNGNLIQSKVSGVVNKMYQSII